MRREELFDKKSSLQNLQDCKGKSPHICRYSINFSVCFFFFLHTMHVWVVLCLWVHSCVCLAEKQWTLPKINNLKSKIH